MSEQDTPSESGFRRIPQSPIPASPEEMITVSVIAPGDSYRKDLRVEQGTSLRQLLDSHGISTHDRQVMVGGELAPAGYQVQDGDFVTLTVTKISGA